MKKITYFTLIIICICHQLVAQPLTGELSYSKVLIYKNQMQYNPTDEFIFPCVIKTDHIENPLGKYYLYYAPHDAPGGICLAYSNSVAGPYTEYTNNPIVSRNHQGRFNVTHVSSSHVMWMPQYNKYFMYFHGENTTTRWAHSSDGINWDLANDNISIVANNWGTGYTECSYARVSEYTIPGVGNRYIMTMMLLRNGEGRKIGLAISDDGKKFTPYNSDLIYPNPQEGGQVSGAFYWSNEGKHYIIYHAASAKIHYTEVGSDFSLKNNLGVFYDPASHYPENNKAADCFLFYEDNRWNMFYTVGLRLKQTIAYAFEAPITNIIIDNNTSGFSSGGSWVNSTGAEGFYGTDYLHDNSSGTSAGSWAKWKPTFPVSGYYKVLVRWVAHENRPSNALYKVYHQGNVSEVIKNQQTNNGSWVYLGRYYFDAGNSENNRLTLDAGNDAGFTIADAAWFILDQEDAVLNSNTFSLDKTNDFAVYPNPSLNSINLNSLEDLTGAQVSIIGSSGNDMYDLPVINTHNLDISFLEAGLYTIIVTTKNGNNLSAKFVKK